MKGGSARLVFCVRCGRVWCLDGLGWDETGGWGCRSAGGLEGRCWLGAIM
jgi:hypothetical protein